MWEGRSWGKSVEDVGSRQERCGECDEVYEVHRACDWVMFCFTEIGENVFFYREGIGKYWEKIFLWVGLYEEIRIRLWVCLCTSSFKLAFDNRS